MKQITASTMSATIAQFGIRKHRPLYFHGKSGIGKSQIMAQAALEHEASFVDIRLSQYESVDLRGIPDIQSGITVWNMPATLPFKGNPKFDEDSGKPIILFLDEINSAEPSTAAVTYQLVQDRQVGEHMLMNNVVITAAGNRAKDRGVINRFPSPLSNRFMHFELIEDVRSWSAWASAKGLPPALIGFLNFREPLLHTFDPDRPVEAFATPRTWEFVAEDMVDTQLSKELMLAGMAGSVGEGPANELIGFLDIMDKLVPIEQIIADPTGTPVDTRLDHQWAMATHIAGNMTADNIAALHQYLKRMAPEMVVMAWTLAGNRNEDLMHTNTFLSDYAPMFRSMVAD